MRHTNNLCVNRQSAGRRLAGLLAVAALMAAACERGGDGDTTEAIPRIEPNSVKITATNATDVVFTAEGGTPAYTWKVMDETLGTLVAAGPTAIYKSKPVAGQNIVTLTDAASNAVSATITQL